MRAFLIPVKRPYVSRVNEEKEESEDEIKGEVGALPTDVLARLNGNSAEEIAELDKEYDFTGVPLVYRDHAKKWYNAPRPSSSRKYTATHPEVLAVYNSWLKWNLTKEGGKPHKYKGDLVKKRGLLHFQARLAAIWRHTRS
jgi:hypothetical protein